MISDSTDLETSASLTAPRFCHKGHIFSHRLVRVFFFSLLWRYNNRKGDYRNQGAFPMDRRIIHLSAKGDPQTSFKESHRFIPGHLYRTHRALRGHPGVCQSTHDILKALLLATISLRLLNTSPYPPTIPYFSTGVISNLTKRPIS